MIVEIRTYTAVPGRVGEFLKLYEELGLPLQQRYLGGLMGFYVSEVGELNQIVHLWRYDSLADRERRRAQLETDPAWAVYKQAFADLGAIRHQDSRILKPTAFSPN